jgi:hypothetical protein
MSMINRPDIPPEELARLRVTYGLRRLSTAVQNAVLSDGVIAERTGIELSHPIHIPGDITIDRSILFKAFASAADAEPLSPIVDSNGAVRQMKVEIDGDAAVLIYETYRVSFPQAVLLASKIDRRKTAATQIASSLTLTRQAAVRFFDIISKDSFTHDDFFAACNILAGAPEAFAHTLHEVAKKGTFGLSDFLPSEIDHWDNLTAKQLSSQALPDFIVRELAEERAARITQDSSSAIEVLSLTFGTFELVPLEALRNINDDELIRALSRLAELRDPYALAAAIDICADRLSSDARFVALGDTILEALVSEPKRLIGDLATFATAFVIGTAYLAQHERLGAKPVFWRRLAAAAHAALVTRVLGSEDEDEHPLFEWAMRLRGKAFYISVLNDAHIEPRWKPDWISPNFLAADIYGRLNQVTQRLDAATPPSWRKRIEEAKSAIVKDVPPVADAFPSLLQGRRQDPPEMPKHDAPIYGIFAEFVDKPSVETFLMFFQLAQAFGLPVALREPVLAAIQSLRAEIAKTNPVLARGALELGAFVAALNRDTELADAVATVVLERLVSDHDPDRLLSAATILIECAAANESRSDALAALARRLENMAFVSKAENLPEAIEILQILQSINDELASLLGRAIATARLGIPRLAAV